MTNPRDCQELPGWVYSEGMGSPRLFYPAGPSAACDELFTEPEFAALCVLENAAHKQNQLTQGRAESRSEVPTGPVQDRCKLACRPARPTQSRSDHARCPSCGYRVRHVGDPRWPTANRSRYNCGHLRKVPVVFRALVFFSFLGIRPQDSDNWSLCGGVCPGNVSSCRRPPVPRPRSRGIAVA